MTRDNIDGEDPPILLLVMLTFDTESESHSATVPHQHTNARYRYLLSDTKLSNIHNKNDKSINRIPNLVKQGHTQTETRQTYF